MLNEQISRQDWDDHIREDDLRGRDVNDLKLAMFGDPSHPDTVKVAVMPTMTRLNTYLDGIQKLGALALALLGAWAALHGIGIL